MKLPSLNTQIFLGAAIGIAAGLALAALGKSSPVTGTSLYVATIVGNLFVDMLKMIVIPLVFASIVVGVTSLRRHHQMHRVWVATLGFFVFSMSVAIVLGLGGAHLFEPGKGLQLSMFADATATYKTTSLTIPDFLQQFLRSIFVNPMKALAEANVLAVVVFSLILGIALVVGGIYATWKGISLNVNGVRDALTETWDRIAVHLLALWDGVKSVATPVLHHLDKVFSKQGGFGKFMLTLLPAALLGAAVTLWVAAKRGRQSEVKYVWPSHAHGVR